MNTKKVLKELGWNKGLKIHDFYGTSIDEDMVRSHLHPLKQFVDIEVGNSFEILVFRWKNKKEELKARRQVKKMFKEFLKK